MNLNKIKKYLINRFLSKKKTPNEYIQQFLNQASNTPIQLELYYNKEPLLLLQSLKYSNLWYGWCDVPQAEFPDGIVLSYYLKKEMINFEEYYASSEELSVKLGLRKFEDVENGMINFVLFLKQETSFNELINCMQRIIFGHRSFSISNPKITYILRELNPI
jgi:hypothetical protein